MWNDCICQVQYECKRPLHVLSKKKYFGLMCTTCNSITCVSEAWTTTRAREGALRSAQRGMQIAMFVFTLRNRKHSIWIRGQAEVGDHETGEQWTGYSCRRKSGRWFMKVTDWIKLIKRTCEDTNWESQPVTAPGIHWDGILRENGKEVVADGLCFRPKWRADYLIDWKAYEKDYLPIVQRNVQLPLKRII